MGFAPAEPYQHAGAFLRWIENGCHAGMQYMAREPQRRYDIRAWEPWTASVIVVAVDYGRATPSVPDTAGRIARYAMGRDYHRWMKKRLIRFGRRLPDLVGAPVRWRPFVDTAPVLERELAMRAGLGWIGKNTMLISPKLGSYLFLGGIVVDIHLPPDTAATHHCGTCTRCMDACPTQAIVAPFVVDARRCIAYHTIESREPIPPEISRAMGNRVFGCDICQEVCPMNRPRDPADPRRSCAANLPDIDERPSMHLPLAELVDISETDFRSVFGGTPVVRAGRDGLRRSARAAMSGQRETDSELLPPQQR